MLPLTLFPSILVKDTVSFNEKLRIAELYQNQAHVDIMDGEFVPNQTIDPEAFDDVRTKLTVEFHLMVKNIPQYIDRFLSMNKKPEILLLHRECCKSEVELAYFIHHLRKQGIRAGIVLDLETPVTSIANVGKIADKILLMSVHPGWSGQDFIASVLPKIKQARRLFPEKNIQLDGGMNQDTIKLAARAGANMFVVGKAFYDAADIGLACERITASAQQGQREWNERKIV